MRAEEDRTTKDEQFIDILRRERRVFQAIAVASLETESTRDLLSRILDILIRLFEFDVGTVRILNPKTGILSLIASKTPPQGEFSKTISIENPIYVSAKVARTRKPIYAPEAKSSPDVSEFREHFRTIGVESIIAWPLFTENEQVMGVISFGSYKPKGLADEHYDFFEAVAKMVTAILERERARDALRRSETKYQTLFEVANDAIFLMSGNKFIQCNPKTLDIFGCSIEEIMNSTPIDHSPLIQPDGRRSDEKAEELLERAYSGEPMFFEWVHKRCDGSLFDAEVSLNRLVLDDETLLLAVVRDISIRKATENKLKEVAETATLYLDILGHDIRNLLQAMFMGTALVREHVAEEATKTAVEMIEVSIESCQRIITNVHETVDLLDIPLHTVSLTKSIEDSIESFIRENDDVEIITEIPDDKMFCVADEHIDYLFYSLLSNAVVHNLSERKKVWISVSEEEGGYRIKISDNGPGIPDPRKSDLLDPNRRFGGVGLQQVLRILKKYNGSISIQDRISGNPDEGARFSIWLAKNSA